MARKNHRRRIVTRDTLAEMVRNENPAYVQAVIGRALVAIFNRQTEDEQTTNETRKHNAIGFTGADARSGSLTAKYWLKHKRLEQWMVDKWTHCGSNQYPRICKYHKQLNDVATNR